MCYGPRVALRTSRLRRSEGKIKERFCTDPDPKRTDMAGSKKTGGNTGSVERSPAKRAREARRRKAQDASWAARSGPVTVRMAVPDVGDGADHSSA
jgi:hypothetical protein